MLTSRSPVLLLAFRHRVAVGDRPRPRLSGRVARCEPAASLCPASTVTARHTRHGFERTTVTRTRRAVTRCRRLPAGDLRDAAPSWRASGRWCAAACTLTVAETVGRGPDAGGRRRRRSRHGRRATRRTGQHAHRRAQLSGRRARHRAAAAERPQLHRPGAAAAGRAAVSASRWRIGGRARPRHERERAGPARERLPARRHAAQRHDQRAGGQRRRDGARHGDRAGVPRRDQRLQRRVRPHERRPDQRADQGRQQRRARQRLRVPSQRRARREELLRRRRQAAVHAQSVRRHRRRADAAATSCSTSSATRACARISGARSRRACPTRTRAAACFRIRPTPDSS